VPVIHIDTRARTTMNDELAGGPTSFGHLNLEEKLEYLQVLSDVVRDIEVELARAEAERGALTSCLESDLQPVLAVSDAAH
jgi:hypothetical protein